MERRLRVEVPDDATEEQARDAAAAQLQRSWGKPWAAVTPRDITITNVITREVPDAGRP